MGVPCQHQIGSLCHHVVQVDVHPCPSSGRPSAFTLISATQIGIAKVLCLHRNDLPMPYDGCTALELFESHVHPGLPQGSQRVFEPLSLDHLAHVYECTAGQLQQGQI